MFIAFTVIFSACGDSSSDLPTDQKDSTKTEKETETITENPDVETDTLDRGLLAIPEKIDEETERDIDEYGIVHIDVMDAAVGEAKTDELLHKLFPASAIEVAHKTDKFSGFNVDYQNTEYNVTVIYETMDDKKIIGFLFIAEGKFSMDVIEKVL